VQPSVPTTANPTSETVNTNNLNDSASINGGFNPTGSITFYLFDPTETCVAPPNGPAAGSFRYSDTIPVNGAGPYSTTQLTGNHPGGFKPDIVGTWNWLAVYSGDGNNNPANSGCGSEPVTITTPPALGLTLGFWHNKNGHAVLDSNGDGFIDVNGVKTSFTIGINATGKRYATVSTIAGSDKILNQSVGACTNPVSFNVGFNGGALSCSILPNKLQVQTLNNVSAQTLTAIYNYNFINGFGFQTLGTLGCTIPASLSGPPFNLNSLSTIQQVIAAANQIIGNAVAGGSTTQTQAGDMSQLMSSCINVA
jgi:hypothetical protein